MTLYTFRELTQQTLINSTRLREAGLAMDAVYDADTVDGPEDDQYPFLVHRWTGQDAQMGTLVRRPFTIWAYGRAGKQDKVLLQALARIAAEELAALEPMQKTGGWLHSYEMVGDGLGEQADLYDPGFAAMVIPRALRVVGSGD